VGVEVHSHTFFSFGRVKMKCWLFVIIIDGLIRVESLTVKLYPIGCGEDETHIEGKVHACTTVTIHINRIRKIFLSLSLNTIEFISNTSVYIETNSLTIFVPTAFYLIG
jgi:hypothetical protein